jgi:glycosyltransferase involved in cell wall biosynthesis
LPRLVEQYQPVAMYVTVPPFSIGPLCVEAARQLGLPLVVDFRDAWSQWVLGPYATWLHYRRVLALEKSCLASASRAVCTSEQTRMDFLRVHPEVAADKITVIMNGYDREISDWQLVSSAPRKGLFVIGYVGNFYYSPAAQAALMTPWWRKRPHRMVQYAPRKEDWLYRSPYFFFRTFARLLERKPELRNRIKLRFAGKKPPWIDEQIAEFGLGDCVELLGYLDHASVLRFQEECDCLLVTSSKVVGGRDYSIAGKTFEYFSIRKPILGFVTEGAQKEILQRSGLAVICDPDDPESSAQKLEALVRGETKVKPNEVFLNTLHRREHTRQLAGLFLDIASKLHHRDPSVRRRTLQSN